MQKRAHNWYMYLCRCDSAFVISFISEITRNKVIYALIF